MNPELQQKLLAGLSDGSIVPYLGPGVLADVRHASTGSPIPAESDSLIIAMNGGKPMAPKLMYEFPRAAMNIELKRGRSAVTKFLNQTYGAIPWTRAAVHDWLKSISPHYVIDINPAIPILFKPMGTPKPEANYIASDADYVDFITELMGGFSIPPEVKELRKGKQYLLIGMRLNRDTERMVMADMIGAVALAA